MSAFLVHPAHIDTLVHAALHRAHPERDLEFHWLDTHQDVQILTAATAERTGMMLYAENARSYNHRYRDTVPPPPYRFTEKPFQPHPVILLKTLDCYEHQSCQTDDWPDTEAASFCRRLRERMMHAVADLPEMRERTTIPRQTVDYVIHDLPGYADAPWQITHLAQAQLPRQR